MLSSQYKAFRKISVEISGTIMPKSPIEKSPLNGIWIVRTFLKASAIIKLENNDS